MKTTCPLCSTRKAKRACPGVHREICAVCCGTKRLTEIACPPDCPYLATARVHPPAVVMRQQDRDMGFVLPRISDLTEMQYRLFLTCKPWCCNTPKATIPSPHDADVADAAATVAATLETAGKGIIYEHQAQSLPAQRLASEIGRSVAELGDSARARRRRASNGTRPPRCDEWSAWRAKRRAKCLDEDSPPSPAGSCSPPG